MGKKLVLKNRRRNNMRASAHVRRNHWTRQTSYVAGLCIKCALRHHDFREIIGGATEDRYFPDTPLPQAWIDGRRHLLQSIMTGLGICRDCNTRVESVYALAE